MNQLKSLLRSLLQAMKEKPVHSIPQSINHSVYLSMVLTAFFFCYRPVFVTGFLHKIIFFRCHNVRKRKDVDQRYDVTVRSLLIAVGRVKGTLPFLLKYIEILWFANLITKACKLILFNNVSSAEACIYLPQPPNKTLGQIYDELPVPSADKMLEVLQH